MFFVSAIIARVVDVCAKQPKRLRENIIPILAGDRSFRKAPNKPARHSKCWTYLAPLTLCLLSACSEEPDPQIEITKILGIDDGERFQAMSHGFPDRHYHARLEQTDSQFFAMVERLKLSADPEADLSWPTATDKPDWWVVDARNLSIFSNLVPRQGADGSHRIIEIGFDESTNEIFVQVSYEF